MSRHIPLAGTGTLDRPLRRTRLVRLGLAGALGLTAAGALVAALALRPSKPNLVPEGTSGIIVLDVSSSIGEQTHRQIAHTLSSAASTRDRYGLVVFSDTAYEALPPGSPGAELRRFERIFRPLDEPEDEAPGMEGLTPIQGSAGFGRRGGPGSGPGVGGVPFPPNPWRPGFSAGTRISTGLRLAQRILRRDGIAEGSILLVSDLDNDQPDIPALTQAVLDIRSAGIPLRVVGLSPDARNRSLWARLLGDRTAVGAAPVRRTELAGPVPAFDRVRLPRALALAAAILLVLLAANELHGARLDWRPRGARGAEA